MASNDDDGKVYALVDYEDPYVQPLILSALEKSLPPSKYQLINSISELPSPSSRLLQWVQYESIDFDHLMEHSSTSTANAYVIRKALIRKHYLSTTVANWITKYPDSLLRNHVKPSVEFEVDYAEFLDDALVEAWDLKESWARNEENEEKDRVWWILKPGMSDRGQGIRLFSTEEELTAIFEEWDPPSDDEEDNDNDARSDAGKAENTEGIMTSQLHFKKFHIRTYILAAGALKVYVHHRTTAMQSHLTNTCLQNSTDRDGSVGLFWDLPDTLPAQPDLPTPLCAPSTWKDDIFAQICSITAATFEAAARGMSIHFQPLPNAFEIFGVDFMVGVESDGG
ncbi:tubulin-tyrosine ligase family-domain-containing protein [Phaeosphaeriaceae sp. PMI808]|nr:tubulin-tyrosine ligase family-domain-containing protein [Phaeosphaeriaceae sp. PMI808]